MKTQGDVLHNSATHAILRQILAFGGEARHKELHKRVAEMSMSRATFHNKLNLLVKTGYLTRYRGSLQRPGSYYRLPEAIMVILKAPEMEALYLVCDGLERSLSDSSLVDEQKKDVLRQSLNDIEKIIPRIFFSIFDNSLRIAQARGKLEPFSYFYHLVLADYFSNLLSVLAERRDLSLAAIPSSMKVRAHGGIDRAAKEILS